jgi:hypothetical protein
MADRLRSQLDHYRHVLTHMAWSSLLVMCWSFGIRVLGYLTLVGIGIVASCDIEV